MADSSTPLTALCSICHSASPKYTCPRDAVRTCSLACSQSHKRRAACSGIRDPAAYVSKYSLQTAGGIDRDYNFLSGLERNIDRADKETFERGVALDGKGKPVFQKRWHDNGALGKYLREHGIVVHRAPIGMARQKANQTRFIQKSKRIVWSVEWVIEGEKRVAEVDECRSIQEAYKELVLEKERENKKRKRTQEDGGAKPQKQKVQTDTKDIGESKTQSVEDVMHREGVTANDTSIAADETTAEDASQEAHSTQGTTHFYLHKPHTSSTSTVLIPLDPTTTLTTALHQKHVLEFPTIYAFASASPTQKPVLEAQSTKDTPEEAVKETNILPKGFITVHQYNEQRTAEDKELLGLMESIPEGQRKIALDGGIFGGGEEKEEAVDEQQILEVLQRDADALKQ